MPPKKEPVKSTNKAKSNKTDDKKPKTKDSPTKDIKEPEGEKPIGATVALVFTKCKDGVSLLVGKETYEKWGPPGGKKEPSEDDKKAVAREFQEETGYVLPKMKLEEQFRYRNTMVFLYYTEECINTKLGPKVKKPLELTELKLCPIKDLYKLLENPKPDMPLRNIFISMMIDHKKEVEAFMKKIK